MPIISRGKETILHMKFQALFWIRIYFEMFSVNISIQQAKDYYYLQTYFILKVSINEEVSAIIATKELHVLLCF